MWALGRPRARKRPREWAVGCGDDVRVAHEIAAVTTGSVERVRALVTVLDARKLSVERRVGSAKNNDVGLIVRAA